MPLLTATLTCLLAASARAYAWEPPPVGPEAPTPARGIPLGEATIDPFLARYRQFGWRLKVEDDRVLGVFIACDARSERNCKELEYSFPDVRVDRDRGALWLDGEVIGKRGSWLLGPNLAEPWRLRPQVTEQPCDPRKLLCRQVGGLGAVELFIEKRR